MDTIITPNTRRANTINSTPGVSENSATAKKDTNNKNNNSDQVFQTTHAFVVEGKADEEWNAMRDLESAKVLFHERVPVKIKYDSNGADVDIERRRERYTNTTNERERVEICSVRILLGGTGSSLDLKTTNTTTTATRVLRVHVSSEANPFFSHAMEVNEEEFNKELKREQNIRVDFNQFPTHFIDLLRECVVDFNDRNNNYDDDDDDYNDLFDGDDDDDDNINGLNEEMKKQLFRRTKTVDLNTTSPSTNKKKTSKTTTQRMNQQNVFFSILTLPRGDGEKHSTFTIYETNKFNTVARLSLRFARASDEQLKRLLAGRLFDANEDRNEFRKMALELRESLANAKKEVKLAREQERLAKMQYVTETAANRTELENERAQLHVKNEALDQRVRELRDELFARTQTQTEIETRNRVLEEEIQNLREEVAESRIEIRNCDNQLRDKDQQHMARKHRVEWLESQLNDKDEVNALVKRRLEQAEAHINSLDKSWAQSRRQTEKAESIAIEYANEIKKVNATIEKLTSELRATKSKSKLRSTVVIQQEQLIDEQKKRLDKAIESKRLIEEEKDELLEEFERTRLKLDEKNRKITEFEEERASDRKMINWLNAQITNNELLRKSSSIALDSTASFS